MACPRRVGRGAMRDTRMRGTRCQVSRETAPARARRKFGSRGRTVRACSNSDRLNAAGEAVAYSEHRGAPIASTQIGVKHPAAAPDGARAERLRVQPSARSAFLRSRWHIPGESRVCDSRTSSEAHASCRQNVGGRSRARLCARRLGTARDPSRPRQEQEKFTNLKVFPKTSRRRSCAPR